MEPEPAALSILEWKPTIQSDQMCELVITSVQVGIIVELEEDDLPPLIPGSPQSVSPPSQICLGPSGHQFCHDEWIPWLCLGR